VPLPGYGYGRLMTLDKPIAISDALQLIKSHLKLNHVRLAIGHGKTSGIVLYLYIYIALLAVHTNQKRF